MVVGAAALFYALVLFVDSGFDLLGSLFPTLFLGTFAWLVGGRVFNDAFRRSRTRYALTSERAIVATGLWRVTVRSAYLDRIIEIGLSVEDSGRGDVYFGDPATFGERRQSLAGFEPSTAVTFELLDDAQQVHDAAVQVRQVLMGARA